MTKDTALRIAEEFLTIKNPGNWNGTGEKPADFDTRMFFYEIKAPRKIRLSLSFEWLADEKEGGSPFWGCVCRRWDHAYKKKQETKVSHILDSKEAISDLIVAVFKKEHVLK